MESYKVINPSSEAELSKRLRAQSFAGAVLNLTVEVKEDDSNEVSRQDFRFNVEHLSTSRPAVITGLVSTVTKDGNILLGAGRLVGGESLDDEENTMTLDVEMDKS